MIEYKTLKKTLLKGYQSGEVLVLREVHRDGKVFQQHFWVKQDDIQKNDVILAAPNSFHYKTCDTSEDADELFFRETARWKGKLTASEHEAVESYSSIAYQVINSSLRKSQLTFNDYEKFILTQIPHLESALSKFELNHDITVHRLAGAEVLRGLVEAKAKGGIYHDTAFCSTTAVKGSVSTLDTVEFVIQVPAGKNRGA